MEEKGTMHVHLLTELTGNLYSEESEWEEEWSESDESVSYTHLNTYFRQ